MKKQGRVTKAVRQSLRVYDKATVYSVDGNRANLQIGGMPNLIKHVEVSGDARMLAPGTEVAIVWKDNRPVVVSGVGNSDIYIPPHDHLTGQSGGALEGYGGSAIVNTGASDYPRGAALLFGGAETNYALETTKDSSQILDVYWTTDLNTYDDAWWQLTCLLAPGDYRLVVTGAKSAGYGICDVYVDGVLVSSGWDWYNSSWVYNHAKGCDFSVAAAGLHTIRLQVNGKRAASTGYRLSFTMATIRPVAV